MTIDDEAAALLNGVMDRYAKLMADLMVTGLVERDGPEMRCYQEAAQTVRAHLTIDQYGPWAPGLEAVGKGASS